MKKVAIVGVEGSGKTVMLAGLGDLYTYPDEEGYMLVPKNFSTAAYVAEKIERMRKGEWPSATAGDEMEGLDWTLKRCVPGTRSRPETVCEVSFLDFAGEVYRTAFGIGEGDASLAGQAEELKRYVREADDLLVLINLHDVIVHGIRDRRVQEAMWITKAILDAALAEENGRKAPRAAIVLSQADSYAETINECGGALGVLQKHLPYVAYDYRWLDVFAVNAVDKTRLDDGGNVVPEADFTEKGLLPILTWIREGMAADGGRGATALPGGTLAAGTRMSRPAGDVRMLALPGGAKMEMIWCPPGDFMMGSPEGEEGRKDNETRHRVTLTKGFWLGKYPVTQLQWKSVMGNNPSSFKKFSFFTSDDRPVENVSWADCQEFIKKVNWLSEYRVRLPTEAEWEYACRAGTATAYFWGNDLNGDKANCDGNHPCGTMVEGSYLRETTAVGKYGANLWGLHDMHGNVWEWCNDRYGDYPVGGETDPTGPTFGDVRVLRGGSWYDFASCSRSAQRLGSLPDYRHDIYGFRLCCSKIPDA